MEIEANSHSDYFNEFISQIMYNLNYNQNINCVELKISKSSLLMKLSLAQKYRYIYIIF